MLRASCATLLVCTSACSLHSLEPLLCAERDPTCPDGLRNDAGSMEELRPDARTPDANDAGIELLYASDNPEELVEKRIRLSFVLKNRARTPVPLSELTVRYYFTTETGGAQEFACSSVVGGSFGCADVRSVSEVASGRDTNRVLVWSFAESAGPLSGDGAETGEIKGLIRNLDFRELDQTNDYSFAARDGLAPHERMTVHRNGELVWGTPP